MKKLLLLLILITGNFIYSQVGIGTDLPNPSTQLEIVSGNRGILIPQVPLTSATDQTTIAAGNIESLLVYNTNTSATLSPGYCYWYQGRWNKLMVENDLPDNIVFWDVVNNEFTYTDENGDVQGIDIADLESLTYLGLNTDDYTLEYTDEDGVVTSIDFEAVIKNFETLTTIVENNDGTFTFVDEAGNTTVIDISNLETLTTIALNADNTHIDYTDENGIVTQLDLTQIVQNLETLTTVVENNDGTFTFVDEAGNTTVIDISNLETLTTIALNADNTHIDYTDENGIVTQLDLTQIVQNLETLTTVVENNDGTFTFVDEAGNTTIIDISNLETITSIQDNGDGTISYRDESGNETIINLAEGPAGQDGRSAYQEWLAAGNTGSAQDFLDSLVGASGTDGADGTSVTVTDNGDGTVTVSDGTTDVIVSNGINGADGVSAYQEWLAAGNTGSTQDFLDSLVGASGTDGTDGTSVTVTDNGDGTVTVSDGTTDVIVSNGTDGADGRSAYQVWLDAGNTGSAQDFLDSLVGASGTDGTDGTSVTVTDNGDGTVTVSDGTTDVIVSNGTDGADGRSAYQEWLAAGNTGSAQDFLDSLIGASGTDGTDGTNGTTPTIGSNGNWFIGATDTGVVAAGQDGASAYQEWLAAGNTGSAQDFLDALVGASGTDGTSVTVIDNGDGTVTVSDGTNDVIVSNGIDGTDGTSVTVTDNGDGTVTVSDGTTDVIVSSGTDGIDGQDGTSAYQEWLAAGNAGSAQDFLDSLVGASGTDGTDGTSVTVTDNGDGTVTVSDGTTDVIVSNGTDGADGRSAYQEWLDAGNTGSAQDFLDSLVGASGTDGADGTSVTVTDNGDGTVTVSDGTTDVVVSNGTDGADGASAYQEWLDAGNTGSTQDFLDSLVGASGTDGTDGTSVTVTDNGDGTVTVSDGTNDVIVSNGIDGTDGTSVTVTDNGDGTVTISDGTNDVIVSNGTDGSDGASAYQEWLDAGNTGSAQDFLDALVGASGTDGADGTSVTVTDNGDGTVTVSDGTNAVVVSNGTDGIDGEDGTSVTVTDNGDGTVTVSDGTNDVIVSNGTDGSDGTSAYQEWLAAGNAGSTQDFLDSLIGASGTDGADGTSVTVTDNGDGTVTVSDGTTDVIVSNGTDGIDGADGTSVTVTDNGDGTVTVSDGTNAVVVSNGTDGIDGEDGTSVMVTDNGDGTVTVSDGTNDVIVSNGTDGIDGQDGTSAYQEWLAAGNAGSAQDFLDSLVGASGTDGADGTSVTVTDNGDGTVTVSDGTNDVIVSNGTDGIDGTDGTSVTVTDNGDGTVTVSDGTTDVVVSNGTDGADGASAYQEWLDAGNTGSTQDFLDSLVGADGQDGIVDPKDLTAGDTSITVTDGIGATIVDTNIIVAEGGISNTKLADDAVTGLKIDETVGGVGLVKNATTNAFDVQANNGLNVDATADAVQLGGALIKPTTITTDATQTLAIAGLQTGTVDNNLVVVEADGTLRQIKAAMPKFFYMPAIIFDTSVNGTFTRNLHSEYQAQFTGTANPTLVSSAGAVNAIPTLPANALEYHITYYDTAVFSNLSINSNGVLTYTIIGSATEASYMTIVFVVK